MRQQLYLCRHADYDSKLVDTTTIITDQGKAQASVLGRYLAHTLSDQASDVFFIGSTMRRSRETIELVAEEIGVGVDEGTNWVQVQALREEGLRGPRLDYTTTVTLPALRRAMRQGGDRPLVAILHGGINIGLISFIAKKSFPLIVMENCSAYLVDVNGNQLTYTGRLVGQAQMKQALGI